MTVHYLVKTNHVVPFQPVTSQYIEQNSAINGKIIKFTLKCEQTPPKQTVNVKGSKRVDFSKLKVTDSTNVALLW